MGQNDVFGDGQSQAGAAGFTGTGFVHPVETLEQARQVLGRNAGTEILHIELDALSERHALPERSARPTAAYFSALSTRFEKT